LRLAISRAANVFEVDRNPGWTVGYTEALIGESANVADRRCFWRYFIPSDTILPGVGRGVSTRSGSRRNETAKREHAMQAHEQCAEGEDRMAKGRRSVRKREALRAWSRPKGIRSWCFTCVVGVLAASPTAFGQSVSGRTVPAQRILSGGDARISARVGEGFFAKYIRLDLTRSSYWAGQLRKPPAGNFGSESDSERQSWYVASTVQRWERPYQTPHWTLVYAFRIPEKPWVRGTIEIDLDSTGVQVGRRGIVG